MGLATKRRKSKAGLLREVKRLKGELARQAEAKRYNGWPNYETWCANLWMGNEEASYHEAQRMADDAWEEAEYASPNPFVSFTRSERARLDLADKLKDWFEESNPLGDTASVFSDLLSAALSEVDWQVIADHWLENEVGDDYETWR